MPGWWTLSSAAFWSCKSNKQKPQQATQRRLKMQKNPTTHSASPPSAETRAVSETAQERFERERLSRRNALKRFGITSARATFAMFSVDDLAHIVGKTMQQRARDNKVAEQVAREFQTAGIASASPSSPPPNPNCQGCIDTKTAQRLACAQAVGYCEDGLVADHKNPPPGSDPCSMALSSCLQGATCQAAACCLRYNCNC